MTDWIAMMEKEDLDLALVHFLGQVENFLIAGELIQGGRRAEAEGLSHVSGQGVEEQHGQFQGDSLFSRGTDSPSQCQGGRVFAKPPRHFVNSGNLDACRGAGRLGRVGGDKG